MRPALNFRLGSVAAALAAGLVGGCGETSAPRPVAADRISLRIAELQIKEDVLDATCRQGLDLIDAARATGREVEVNLGDCLRLLPLRKPEALAPLLRRFTPYFEEDHRLSMVLEQASRGGTADDLSAAGRAVLDAAGWHDGVPGFDALDADSFWAGRGALRAAAAAGDSKAAEQVRTLEAFEFPLPERTAHHEVLLNVYFRRWPADTLPTRSVIAGFAIGWRDICTQWETGMNSVQYSRGLAALLSPVQAQVPGRVIAAVPAIGKRIVDGAANAAREAPEHGAAGVLHQLLLAANDSKREFDSAVAVASAGGRDAGIAMYQAVGNCRAPRALRLVDALVGAFGHYAPLSPTQAALPAAAVAATTQKEDTR